MQDETQENGAKSANVSAGTTDLKMPGISKQLAKRIKDDIDDWCIDTFDDGFRWHLGGSVIGQECSRAAWYSYRWAGKMKFAGKTPEEVRSNHGRMQRLFQRGHLEEFRFVEYLRGTGWTVYDYAQRLVCHDETGEYRCLEWGDEIPMYFSDVSASRAHIEQATEEGDGPKQWRVKHFGGHFGGSLDGIALPPPRYGLPEGTAFLCEFKTQGTGANFVKLCEKGVQLAKEQHFSQMSIYGSDPDYRIEYGLYQATNKNDDSLHIEIAKLDWTLGDQLRDKAERIITSRTPPLRLSDNPTFYKCKFCDFFAKCHENAPLDKNCRSCKFAIPVEGGEWKCEKVNNIIPRDFVPQGCSEWRTVNDI